MSLKTNGKGLRGIQGSAAGASLVELLVVLAITGVVTTGIYSFFLTTTQTYTNQTINARMLLTASNAMSLVTRDLRQAGTIWATPCALTPLVAGAPVPPLVNADNTAPGRITIRVLLDDPSARTEIAASPASGQAQGNSTFAVVSTTGFQKDDIAFITDGVQCTRFKVAETPIPSPPGLPASNHSSTGAGYTYPVGTSLVSRRVVDQTITYTITTFPDDPNTPWLTRDTGSGSRRMVPNVESLSFSFMMNDTTTCGSLICDPATAVTAAQAANIRAVTVNLGVKADTRDSLLRDFRRRTLAAMIKLRNLGS